MLSLSMGTGHFRFLLAALYVVSATNLACTEDDSDSTVDSSEGDELDFFSIPFRAMIGDQVAACGVKYFGIGTKQSEIELRELAFYVHNVQLRRIDGALVPFELEDDGRWQSQGVALLDFADHGSSLCAASGTAATNQSVRGYAAPGEYTGIVFSVGIPEHLNHLNSPIAPAPLNAQGMWWSWSSGFRYIKLEVQATSLVDGQLKVKDEFYVHTGANGCQKDITHHQVACSDRRISSFELDFRPQQNVVRFDIGQFFSKSDLSVGRGCMGASNLSDPQDGENVMSTACFDYYLAFGLDTRGEVAVPTNSQTAFFSAIGQGDQVAPSPRPTVQQIDTPMGWQDPVNWPHPEYIRAPELDVEIVTAPNTQRSHPPGDLRYGKNCMQCHQSYGPGVGQFVVAGSIFQENGQPYSEGKIELVLAGEKSSWTAKNPEEKVPLSQVHMEIPIDSHGQFYTTQGAVQQFAATNGSPVMDYNFSNYQAFVVNRDGNRVMAMSPKKPGACNLCHSGDFSLVIPDRLQSGPWTPPQEG